jgi:hypothetical protein
MKVRELIELLTRFDPESDVHLCISSPGRVISVHEQFWVADYGGGPQLNAAPDVRHFQILAGLGVEQTVGPVPRDTFIERQQSMTSPDLGHYEDDETTARVADFYMYHRRLDGPLKFPDFDYEHWIPPRTRSGEYNPLIAEILREKLLRD